MSTSNSQQALTSDETFSCTQAEREYFARLDETITPEKLAFYRKMKARARQDGQSADMSDVGPLQDKQRNNAVFVKKKEEDTEIKQKQKDYRERHKRRGPVWGTTSSEEENALLRFADTQELSIPEVCYERLERMQPFPISLLRRHLLDFTYRNPDDPKTKRLHNTKLVYDLDDDYALAASLSDDFLPALSLFVQMVKNMADLKKGQFTPDAHTMIDYAVIRDQFFKAKTFGEQLDVLLYDIARRKLLFFKRHEGAGVNISAFHQPTFDRASRLRHEMQVNRDKTPNVFDYLLGEPAPQTQTRASLGKRSREATPDDVYRRRPQPGDSHRRYDTYDNGNRVIRGGPEHRGRHERGNSQGGSGSYRCFGCGSTDHGARQCRKTHIEFGNGFLRASRFVIDLLYWYRFLTRWESCPSEMS